MFISFDFDDTLTQSLAVWDGECLEEIKFLGPNLPIIERLKTFVEQGQVIRVITSRSLKWERDTLEKLEAFGILNLIEEVHHTNGKWKAEWCLENNLIPIKHFDDDQAELAKFKTLLPNVELIEVALHPSWRGVK